MEKMEGKVKKSLNIAFPDEKRQMTNFNVDSEQLCSKKGFLSEYRIGAGLVSHGPLFYIIVCIG